ncbi:GTP cyclohydrolase I FolE [Lactococcus nasutitermitis]|uniref:GTP cyclohydrolase 1 n=1 Tax=Lactococcus nasutitermitis TaxID=1652957 RepID=A0ABV9JGC9_9LACT|nr:GTP cyclohydrolase I FolE [Lactococcus nasutitermitis]
MQTVYLSLGSNIGDKQYYLHEAVQVLGKNPQILIEKKSKFYTTSPVGEVIQDDFINLAVRLSTTLSPQELLLVIHDIETALNRERTIHWGPRTIDIDILFYGDMIVNEETLIIPHKEIFNRLFVLIPLLDLIDNKFAYFSKITEAIDNLKKTNQEIREVAEEMPAQQKIEKAIYDILSAVGENPEREGLLETPTRVAKMYKEILSSQHLKKFTEYKLFEIEKTSTEQMVLIKDIPFYSMCEHHMLPFFGKVHVAYIPSDGKIIGLSKIPRLVDYVSHKLSVQENITRDVAEILNEILEPKGVAVVVEARHMCIEMRGVRKINSLTQTSFYLGEFDKNRDKKTEFLESLL